MFLNLFPPCQNQHYKNYKLLPKLRHEGGVPVTDFTKLDIVKKKDKNIKRISKFFKESIIIPDEKEKIVRPPAVYSNSTPYGIADELLRGK